METCTGRCNGRVKVHFETCANESPGEMTLGYFWDCSISLSRLRDDAGGVKAQMVVLLRAFNYRMCIMML